ncbi:hypothetical protein BMF94_2512 [Rhodotorula taiwanensis]|uniref:Uncharacterized protein n=1 Tax=Rhodotorula taiwanensis TaxID=741276 RepID=A0A2S5BC27_9BASI|nr:hypothetical protein BMF94_2512 [Rhodotorula taiwanensis]
MFGECHSESPRLPSPWLSRSSGGSPSPLNLPSPNGSSSPTTPTDTTAAKGFRARRRSSLEELDLFHGLADELQDCHLGKGGHGARARPDEVTVVEIERVTLLNANEVGLEPEVDHQGNIEYKLKIAMPTSIHRLEKLRTQLKWRLVEGGGTAIYELGLLDDGTLVGLNRDEMEQSLKTLAQMLAGLGGGRVQISRVIRIGQEQDGAATVDASSDHPATSRPSLFPSFDVVADDDDIAFVASGTPPVVDPVTGETSIFPPPRIRGPTPYPIDRSNTQQAAFRRDKRDARRFRRREAESLAVASSTMALPSRAGSQGSLSSSSPPSTASSPCSTRSSTPASSESPSSTLPIPIPPRSFQASYPAAIEPRAKPVKPPKPPRPTTARLRKSDSRSTAAALTLSIIDRSSGSSVRPTPKKPRAADSHVTPFKPVLPHECAEVRYVVEAIVRKAGTTADPLLGGGGRRRRKSSAGSGHSEERGPRVRRSSAAEQGSEGAEHDGAESARADEDDDNVSDGDSLESGDEGWNYLDFDLSAVAAAATAAHAAASSSSSSTP